MHRRSANALIKRLTYANVIATMALFVALGGGAYAVSVGKNSIGSKEIKNGEVKGKDIKNGQVKSSDLKNEGIKSGDLKAGSVGTDAVGDDSLTGSDVVESSLGEVPAATVAGSAGKADSAATAGSADSAAAAGDADLLDGRDSTAFGPRAFAYIDADGTVDAGAPSQGIANANVTKQFNGAYCFYGLDFPVRSISVTTSGADQVFVDSVANATIAQVHNETICNGPEQAAVTIQDIDAGTLEDEAFFVVFP